ATFVAAASHLPSPPITEVVKPAPERTSSLRAASEVASAVPVPSNPAGDASQGKAAFYSTLSAWRDRAPNRTDAKRAHFLMHRTVTDDRADLDLQGLDIPMPPDLSLCTKLMEVAVDWKQARQWGNSLGLPAGCRVKIGDMTQYKDAGSSIAEYSTGTLDMNVVLAHQEKGYHKQQIAGAGNGCWWRATWGAALLDEKFMTDPQRLRAAIVDALGSSASTLANHVALLAQQLSPAKSGAGPKLANILSETGRYKSVAGVDTEAVLTDLTKQLLLRAGFKQEEMDKLFNPVKPLMGSDVQIFAVLRQLGVDGFLHHQPTYAGVRGDWTCKRSEPAQAGVDSGRPGNVSRLAGTAAEEETREGRTARWIDRIRNKPVLLHGTWHFDLLVPTSHSGTRAGA
ncbi:MAG: hypothetical protein ACRYGK_04875, partial [Janthinobacterium lividum]